MADDEIEPERKFYTLRPKSFERVNRPTHEELEGTIDVHAMLQQNLAADPHRPPIERSKPSPSTIARGDAVPPVLPVARTGSRRPKDFFTALVCGAAVLAISAFLLRESEFALIAIGSAFVLFALLMVWIFWGIMDRY
jgi:hypothetical protein